jgi:hypothetical protein
MKYAVEMDSGAMMYIPSFIKIESVIHKLIEWDTKTHRQRGNSISIPLYIFFQNKESRLKSTEQIIVQHTWQGNERLCAV